MVKKMSEIELEIDGNKVLAEEEQTILEVASEQNIEIPTHCYREPYEPIGQCRLCLVEVRVPGEEPNLKAACTYPVQEDLVVKTDTEKVRKARKMTAELLLARCPNSEAVQEIAKELGVEEPRFSKKELNCTLCGLCVRACKKTTGNNVITFIGRGPEREIMSPFELSPEECQGCGKCVDVCPTGVLEMVEIEED